MEVFDNIMNFKENKMYSGEDICLTEQQFGLFDSIPEEKWEELYPNEYASYIKFRSQKGKFWDRLPMGESPFDVAVRIKVFLGTLKRDCENHKIDTVFIFTYGVTLRTFVMQYLHFPVSWYENESNPKKMLDSLHR